MLITQIKLKRKEFIASVLKSLIPVATLVGILDFMSNSKIAGITDIIASILAIFTYYYAQYKGSWNIVTNITSFLGYVVFTASALEKMDDITFPVWLPVYGIFFIMVSGIRDGLIWILLTLVTFAGIYLLFYSNDIIYIHFLLYCLAFIISAVLVIIYDKSYDKQFQRLYNLASFDHLTTLMNRRYILEVLQHEISYSRRKKVDLSVLSIDVDHFKTINDQYGHDKGDIVLQHVANVLKKNIRNSDYIGRIGGEEFLIICSATKSFEAQILSQKLIKLFKKSKNAYNPTVSIGIAGLENEDDINSLLKKADLALYQAKNAGRDCAIQFNDKLQTMDLNFA